MKHKMLLLACSLSAAAAYAQPHAGHAHDRAGATITYSSRQPAHSTARTTAATGSRCIAEVYYRYDAASSSFVIYDSSSLSYSGTRANWYYDNGMTYKYAGGVYSNDYKRSQTFDVNNNCTLYLGQQWNNTSSTWINANQGTYTYDASNRMMTTTYQTWNVPTSAWIGTSKYAYTYTGANVATETYQYWNSTTASWDLSNRYSYTYDAMNNRISELGETWNAATSTWKNSSRYTSVYDASNNRTSQLNEYWNSTTSAWEVSSKSLYSSYSGTYPQVEIYQQWDAATSAFVNNKKYVATTNGYSQPTYEYSQTWNTTTNAWEYIDGEYADRYYYEEYTTGIAKVNAGGRATTFPIPACNTVSIDISWNEAQACTIAMYDVQGKMVRSFSAPVAKNYQANIDVSALPAGNYFIKMQGTQSSLTETVIVAK